MKKLKVKESCPYIDNVLELLDGLDIPIEVLFQMRHDLEVTRSINSQLRSCISKEIPYNFSAVIKTLKIKLPESAELIDEVVTTYL